MTNHPLVSVVISTRNSGQRLEACLQTIRAQTYKEIELIIVDRESTDNTTKIASRFTSHVFQYGPERSAQRNFGVSKANGKYVLIIDADMELDPEVIEACVEKINSNPNCQALIIPEESFGEGFWARCKNLERSFYHGVDWIEAARFFERTLYNDLGGYNEALVSGEDWDLSSRAAQRTTICRTDKSIYHNEGKLRLLVTLKKKFYYAGKFTKYTAAAREETQAAHGAQPTDIVLKRFGLFFSDPGKLFYRPHVGMGMLFMKICEFGFGAFGYIAAQYGRGQK